MEERMIGTSEFARRRGIGYQKLLASLSSGLVPGSEKLGRHWRIPETAPVLGPTIRARPSDASAEDGFRHLARLPYDEFEPALVAFAAARLGIPREEFAAKFYYRMGYSAGKEERVHDPSNPNEQ